MDRRYLIGMVGIIILFSIGLVGYFEFSADYGDGLEVTMEEAGVEEHDQIWEAPLDYGEDYGSALVAGLIGFGITLGAVYGHTRLMRSPE